MTRRAELAGTAILTSLLAIAGCTAGGGPTVQTRSAGNPAQARLTAFDGCAQALAGLRGAAEASVGPFGLPDTASASPDGEPAAGASSGSAAASSATPAYSGTNDYQAGVDEPDLVKTDGRRIVTVAGGVLRVIDAASRTQTGQLRLASVPGLGSVNAYQPVSLLLDGDHALLLVSSAYAYPSTVPGGFAQPFASGPALLLVGLSGQPRVLSVYRITGNLLDARQVGSAVRVVIGSQPRFTFPPVRAVLPAGQVSADGSAGTVRSAIAANRAAIARAGIDAWLPEFSETAATGTTITGRVPCGAIIKPADYSGASLLTVLTFNIAATALGTGDAVTLAADGNTVYGTGSSLYVAADTRWRLTPASYGAEVPAEVQHPVTYVYRFDTTGPGAPRFVAGGSVPGYLLNQYSLSEWDGYLRVATTTGTSWALADGAPSGAQTSSSAVYVLTTGAPVMRIAGQVTGLGVSERIYAVRFIGPVGYVVTFRQTDPLYTLDLSDPAHPRVRGALALTGYSAYLHPVSATRLIGIGRQADSLGHVGGLQISLFDTSKLASPARLATYSLAGATSDAEFDPHAFLYWPASRLVVVPLQQYAMPSGLPGVSSPPSASPLSGALVLRIAGAGIARAGFVSQPSPATTSGPDYGYQLPIERSLVIGQTLWTLSGSGLLASDLSSLKPQGWIPFG